MHEGLVSFFGGLSQKRDVFASFSVDLKIFLRLVSEFPNLHQTVKFRIVGEHTENTLAKKTTIWIVLQTY